MFEGYTKRQVLGAIVSGAALAVGVWFLLSLLLIIAAETPYGR